MNQIENIFKENKNYLQFLMDNQHCKTQKSVSPTLKKNPQDKNIESIINQYKENLDQLRKIDTIRQQKYDRLQIKYDKQSEMMSNLFKIIDQHAHYLLKEPKLQKIQKEIERINHSQERTKSPLISVAQERSLEPIKILNVSQSTKSEQKIQIRSPRNHNYARFIIPKQDKVFGS
ncbi:hypothetical protein pb186bvf_004142 [Paramecium bursaria]